MIVVLSLWRMLSAPPELMHTRRTPPWGSRSMAEIPTFSLRQRAITAPSSIARWISRLIAPLRYVQGSWGSWRCSCGEKAGAREVSQPRERSGGHQSRDALPYHKRGRGPNGAASDPGRMKAPAPLVLIFSWPVRTAKAFWHGHALRRPVDPRNLSPWRPRCLRLGLRSLGA